MVVGTVVFQSHSFTKEEGETLGAHLGASVLSLLQWRGVGELRSCFSTGAGLPTARVKYSLLKGALGQTRICPEGGSRNPRVYPLIKQRLDGLSGPQLLLLLRVMGIRTAILHSDVE